ncbi:MAG: hypothetical protein QM539_08500 [Alphaproteobacteria bacterium]|nr:hypothetical protein [Alphaproteobacteria bacterium]
MKIFTFAILFLSTLFTFAQSDFDKIQLVLFFQKKPVSAKKEFDKMITKNPTKYEKSPEALFYDLAIAYTLSQDEKEKANYPLTFDDMLKKLNTYIEADDTLKFMKSVGFTQPLYDVYQHYSADGRKSYDEQKWEDVETNFRKSLEYSTIMFKNGLTPLPRTAYDTLAYIFIAYSCQNQKKYEEAFMTMKKLIDDNYDNESELKNMFNFILVYTADKLDRTEFIKYISIAEKKLPNDDWDAYKFDYIYKTKSDDIKYVDELYNELSNKNKLDEKSLLQFYEFFINAKDKNPNLTNEELNAYKKKAFDCLQLAFNKNPNNLLTIYSLGGYNKTQLDELDSKFYENVRKMREINSNPITEKDPAKKKKLTDNRKAETEPIQNENKQLNDQIIAQAKVCIDWFEKSLSLVQKMDTKDRQAKAIERNSCNFLAELCEKLRDKYRGVDDKLFNDYDAKFNTYDKLFETLK